MSSPKYSPADQERAAEYARQGAKTPKLNKEQYQSQTRRALLTGGAAAAAGLFGWRWLLNRPENNNIPDALRRGHEINESLWSTLSRDSALAPTFARSESSEPRVNGRHGIRDDIDLDAWELAIEGPDGSEIGRHDLADVQSFAKVEMTIEHKCVEGWSHIVTWGGTPFAKFAAQYKQRLGDLPKYVYLETPDGDYYVAMDRASMMHPQTLLTYELQGEPLSQEHGAPLRLTTPNKYGIKQIKRIGTIRFTDERPTDYWFERGYDWYAQL